MVESRNFEIDPEDANDVVGALKAARFKKFIIVEDFHYLAEEVQHPLAVDLKVFHENSNLVFIIVGVWLEADRLSVYNGDLSGRISTINLDDWKQEELPERCRRAANRPASPSSLLPTFENEKLRSGEVNADRIIKLWKEFCDDATIPHRTRLKRKHRPRPG